MTINNKGFNTKAQRHKGRKGNLSGSVFSMPLWFLLALLLLAMPVYAQQQVSDDDVNRVAGKMYCPVCENIPLDVCATATCMQWKQEIRDQLAAGKTDDQIIANFVQRFGEKVIGTPQDPFLRALSLITPWVVSIVALIVGVITFMRWRANRGGMAAIPAVPRGIVLRSDEEYRQQIENDLKARR
jgi:cytochrome c-type biogenesis protein CcmH